MWQDIYRLAFLCSCLSHARIAHLLKELGERAQIQLKTNHMDGKQHVLTWYYHVIPIAKYIEEESGEKQP